MARRKKEPEGFHRDQIARTAQRLFEKNGVERTTMDEIAKASGYSKATLYVYFKNKEELVGELTYRSMKMLEDRIIAALSFGGGMRKKYDALCRELVEYQRRYPHDFNTVLGKISIDWDGLETVSVNRLIYESGERINGSIAAMLEEGIRAGELIGDLDCLQTVFVFWSSLSGIIRMAADKQEYLENVLGIGREAFLAYGFDLLYRSIGKETRHE